MNEDMLRRMAAQAGISTSQMVGMATGPQGGQVTASGMQEMLNRNVNNLLGGRPADRMRQLAQERFGTALEEITPAQAAIIARQVQQEGLMPDTRSIQTAMARSGIENVSTANAGATAVMAVGGEFNLETEAMNPQDVQGMDWETQQGWLKEQGLEFEDAAGYNEWRVANANDNTGVKGMGRRDTLKPKAAYASWASETGKTSPAIEALFNKGYSKSDRFVVQTEDGEKDVSFEEAVKFYPEQLARGEAMLIESKKNKDEIGTTVSDITGLGDSTIEIGAGQKRDYGKGREFEYDKWKDKRVKEAEDDAKDAKGGKIMVEASPILANLIRMSGTGVTVNYGPSGGNPPLANLPTGTPGTR
jgi:hypothetical protein